MSARPEATPDSGHPLKATLERVGALDAYFAAKYPDSLPPAAEGAEGWLAAPAICANNGGCLDALLAQVLAKYRTADRKIAASFFLSSYAWNLAGAAVAAYFTERRVPRLAAENMRFRFEVGPDETQVEVAFRAMGFAALADDPAATAAPWADDARLAPTSAALSAILRADLEAHLAPLVAALEARTGLGARAQWSMIADACASIFLWAGQKSGQCERACAEGLAFVKAAGSPMGRSKTTYFSLALGDKRETFLGRGACCLYYKVPDGRNCSTCPLVPAEERDRRLLEWMAPRDAVG